MTKIQSSDVVGDTMAPSLFAEPASLRDSPVYSCAIPANFALKAFRQSAELSWSNSTLALPPSELNRTSCEQSIWMSFFFDGTGNNLKADVGSLKHSSVARLFRVHKADDSEAGIYRIYVPGVGTYFADIKDDGGNALGLAAGYMGHARLIWALKQFDQKLVKPMARATNSSNKIREINVAVFGFSRGAALARAFVNMLLETRCQLGDSGQWHLKSGGHNLRVPFVGLFDTVASVGLPMSTNNTSKTGAAISNISYIINNRLHNADFRQILPAILAFADKARAGADPAPGPASGHDSWGSMMVIPENVGEVRHFIAAHEMRNSFPVESISALKRGKIVKPAHFYETVYPGVHSDVGGGYRPGEGGRSESFGDGLGLIPLNDMYRHALAQGVPMLAQTAWEEQNKADFNASDVLLKRYNHYTSNIVASHSLGALLNAHAAIYFAWRFRSIRQKRSGDIREFQHIARMDAAYTKEERVLRQQVAKLNDENNAALSRLQYAEMKRTTHINNNYGASSFRDTLKARDNEVNNAKDLQAEKQDELLLAQARLDSTPKMGGLQAMLDLYDEQLLRDAKAIHDAYTKGQAANTEPSSAKRENLRPHYRELMVAYENEFIHNKGMNDEKIIAFFENHVHDSLAGFAKDATLPSDPRVVYLGGDIKFQYAALERDGLTNFGESRTV